MDKSNSESYETVDVPSTFSENHYRLAADSKVNRSQIKFVANNEAMCFPGSDGHVLGVLWFT
jgi:hypothetical protein